MTSEQDPSMTPKPSTSQEVTAVPVGTGDWLGSEIYILLADGDGTMRSSNEPFGVAVTTEAEAKRFVKDGGVGYTHSYTKVRIFSDKDKAIAWRYPKEPNKTDEPRGQS